MGRSGDYRGLPQASRLGVEAREGNELALSLLEYLNLIFLLDLNAYMFTVESENMTLEGLASRH